MSYFSFCLSFLSAIAFLWLDQRLKHKQPPAWVWPLASIEKFNLSSLIIGFLLLSLGIGTGVIATKLSFGRFFIGDPKELWTLLNWFTYAIILWIRCTQTLRGPKMMILASLAFGLVLFTATGVDMLFSGIHSVK